MLPVRSHTSHELEWRVPPTDWVLVLRDFETDTYLYADPKFARLLRPALWLWINRDFFRILGVRLGFLWLNDFAEFKSARFGWRFWANKRSWWFLCRLPKPRYGSLSLFRKLQ
jgi:hypothetical protein